MKVSLDGGLTFVGAPEGIRVVYDQDELEENCELHINITNEGVIFDAWVDDDNVGTSSETADEIVERLIEGNL